MLSLKRIFKVSAFYVSSNMFIIWTQFSQCIESCRRPYLLGST